MIRFNFVILVSLLLLINNTSSSTSLTFIKEKVGAWVS